MKAEIQTYRNLLERQKGQKMQVEQSIELLKQELQDNNRNLRRHEKAREIIREVGIKTQQQLSFHISDITSLALEAVFNEPYELKVEFVQRRNKTECDLIFEREGVRLEKPKEEAGGGAIDVASFALRIASWSMMTPKTRNVMILDEPFKHLKGETENRNVLNMIREISQKLNLQIIMVSDERVSREATLEATDKLFEVSIKKGVSKVI